MKAIKIYLAVYMCAIALLTELSIIFFRNVVPAQYPIFLPVIPIYFILLGLVSVLVSKNFLNSNTKANRNWILFRYCKIVLSIVLLFVYTMTVHKTILGFLLTFLVFYFVLMIVEMIFMLNIVRRKESK